MMEYSVMELKHATQQMDVRLDPRFVLLDRHAQSPMNKTARLVTKAVGKPLARPPTAAYGLMLQNAQHA